MSEYSQVIPAQSGSYVLQTLDLRESHGCIEIVKIPIVAWVVTYSRSETDDIQYPFATPVTFEGVTYAKDPLKGLIIMDADGAVHDPFMGWWPTLEEYEQYVREADEHKRMQAEDL